MAIAIGIAWLLFMYVGVPIAFVLGASAMVGVLLAPDGFDLLPALVEQMFIAVSSFNFLAIPLFVFAGGVLAEGGVAKILMDLASITVGRGRGGLAASIVMSERELSRWRATEPTTLTPLAGSTDDYTNVETGT